MRFAVLFSLCLFSLSGCSEKSSSYYWEHPQQLRDALTACQNQHANPNCEKLYQIGYSMNVLALELQSNPQRFGSTLMKLQMELAEKKQAQAPSKQSTHSLLEPIEQEIQQRLAVIKWLESPEK